MNHDSNNPKVSVILPTYNRAHLIKRAIQSVLDQTYQNFEIIVVDDGSTDNTEEQVRSFNNPKIRYIRYNENKGAAFARNAGIKASRGDYIAFQDSDDEWFPHKLQRQMEAFKNASPEVGVVYTGSWRIKDNERIYLPLFKGKIKEGNICRELFERRITWMSTPVVIVKKECFNREGMFDERLLCHEDWELWLRISKYYEFKYIDEPSVNLYFTSDSISFNLNNSIEDRKLILNKHLEEFRKNQKSLARYFFHIGVDLCLSNKPKQARGYFLKSLKTHPFNIKFLPTVLISLFIPALCIKTIKLYAEAKGKFINFITSLTRGSGYENRY